MSHTSPASRTSSSGRTPTAEATLAQTSNGRRRTRSTNRPNSGANSDGSTSQKKVIPAAPLEPVSDLTHIASTISITESPNMLVERPVNRRPKPFCANALRIVAPSSGVLEAVRGHAPRHQGAQPRALGPGARVVVPFTPAGEQVTDGAVDLGQLGRRQPEHRLVRGAGLPPGGVLVVAPGAPLGQPGPPPRTRARPACAGATSSWPATRQYGRRAPWRSSGPRR